MPNHSEPLIIAGYNDTEDIDTTLLDTDSKFQRAIKNRQWGEDTITRLVVETVKAMDAGLEDRLMEAIAERFGLPGEEDGGFLDRNDEVLGILLPPIYRGIAMNLLSRFDLSPDTDEWEMAAEIAHLINSKLIALASGARVPHPLRSWG